MKRKLISTNMKIFILILFLLTITFYASGCIILVQSGYKLSDYADELNLNTNSFEFNFNDSTVSSEQVLNQNINSIEFNLNSQDIQLKNYEGNVIKIQISSNSFDNSVKLPVVERDNKLIFSVNPENSSNANILVSIPSSYKDKGGIKITTNSSNIKVSNFSCNSLNISTGNGDVYMSNVDLNYLNLNTSTGNINLNNIISLNETAFNSTSGDIKVNGNLGILTSHTTSGNMSFEIKDSLKDISLNTVSGDVSLSLPKDLGYKIKYNTLSGTLTSPTSTLSSGDESTIINVTTTSGNMNVT